MSQNNKIDLNDVSFIIPVRIDSLERFENVCCVTTYILNHFETNIMVLEADKENSGLLKKHLNDQVNVLFIEDDDPVFHRTKYINKMVYEVRTRYLAIWDADVVVNPQQIQSAVESLRTGKFDFIYPYDGRYMETGVAFRRQFLNTFDITPLEESGDNMIAPYTTIACGGGFVANRAAYIRTGLENENFYGWGPEDAERLRRWHTLEMNVGRVKGYMFHLYHPRGRNSDFRSEETRLKLIGELNRIGIMSKEELELEIKSWLFKWSSYIEIQ